MILKAYQVNDILVFAHKGTEAKLLAAPLIKSNEQWRKDVSGWVALRAERMPELDSQADQSQADAYIANK